ncbi:MAG TPA: cell division protein SepF [Acidimicrobiales bacterium]
MASMWRKAMLYLGLGPDEEYDDYEIADDQRHVPPPRPAPRRPGPVMPRDPDNTGSVRTLSPAYGDDDLRPNGNGTSHATHDPPMSFPSRPAPVADRGLDRERERERPAASAPRSAVVRPLATGSPKPHVVGPASFTDAQEVADKFKVNVPVILNLQGVDRDLSRRIIDFASGLCYGLGGQMERVANRVYLLTPSDVEVSQEERRRLQERGYEA